MKIYDVVDDTLEITGYADVDLDTCATSEATQTYTIADEIVIAIVEDGVLTETTSNEIVAGGILVICLDNKGVTNITVYHVEDASTTWSIFPFLLRKCLHFLHKSSVSIQLPLSLQCYLVCEDLHGILHREERYVRFDARAAALDKPTNTYSDNSAWCLLYHLDTAQKAGCVQDQSSL